MRKGNSVSKHLAIGLASGLVASWAMNEFFAVQSKLQQRGKPEEERKRAEQQQEQRAADNPTVKVGEAISTTVFHHSLEPREKKTAGSVVHYAFGALMGGLYGAIAERAPKATAGFGSAYGTALWLGADEIMVPVLKLSPPPQQFTVPQHLSGLGAHLTYGVTTEAVRRLLRAIC